MICPWCKNEIADDTKYCPKCAGGIKKNLDPEGFAADEAKKAAAAPQHEKVAPVAAAPTATPASAPVKQPVAALVLGILSVVLFATAIGGIVLGIIGLVLSIKANGQNKTGMGTAAFVLSLIGLILGVILLIAGVILGAALIGSSLYY